MMLMKIKKANVTNTYKPTSSTHSYMAHDIFAVIKDMNAKGSNSPVLDIRVL